MKVRFAPSPTGSLHIGNALGAVINRNFGGTMLLRIDDTDPARNLPGGEEAILEDLGWLGVGWDEGPVRQSDRRERYREAAARDAAAVRGRDAPPRRRLRDLPARERRRRRRLRDHARDPRQRPPAERGDPSAACTRRSAPCARVPPPRARCSGTTGRRSRSAPRARPSRRCARTGIPPRRCARTSRSSASRGTTCTSTCPGSAGSRSRRSRRFPTTSCRAVPAPVAVVRPCAARAT